MPAELSEGPQRRSEGPVHAARSFPSASARSARTCSNATRREHLGAAVAAAVVVGGDEAGDLPAGLVPGLERLAGQQLMLEGRVPALGGGVVEREPTRPIDLNVATIPYAAKAMIPAP